MLTQLFRYEGCCGSRSRWWCGLWLLNCCWCCRLIVAFIFSVGVVVCTDCCGQCHMVVVPCLLYRVDVVVWLMPCRRRRSLKHQWNVCHHCKCQCVAAVAMLFRRSLAVGGWLLYHFVRCWFGCILWCRRRWCRGQWCRWRCGCVRWRGSYIIANANALLLWRGCWGICWQMRLIVVPFIRWFCCWWFVGCWFGCIWWYCNSSRQARFGDGVVPWMLRWESQRESH